MGGGGLQQPWNSYAQNFFKFQKIEPRFIQPLLYNRRRAANVTLKKRALFLLEWDGNLEYEAQLTLFEIADLKTLFFGRE